MPAAANLNEATYFIVQNIFALNSAATDLIARTNTWLTAFAELNTAVADQKTMYAWIVPTLFARNRLPTGAANQDTTNIQELIEIMSRSLDKLRNTTSLTAPQIAAILVIYNSAWT